MIKYLSIICIALLCPFSCIQAQELSLQDIYASNKFHSQGFTELRSTADGEHYTLLEKTSKETKINKYKYIDGSFKSSLFCSSDFTELNNISGYTLSSDEKNILIATNSKSIFRRSFKAVYYVYNIPNNTLSLVDKDPIQEARLSPDGTKVAYCKDNNIYYKILSSGNTVQVTHDGKADSIINGTSDWVYEEEFSIVRMFDWSPSGKYLAYVKFNQTQVPLYGMDIYSRELYPDRNVFKYPKAGEKNSTVSLWIYSLADAKTSEIDTEQQEEFYLPRIGFTGVEDELYYITLNRLQDHMQVNITDVNSLTSKELFAEKDKRYINLNDFLTFLPSGDYFFVSDCSGYSHLYKGTRDGKEPTQITKGEWNVTNLYLIDPKSSTAYIQTTQDGSPNRRISSVDLRNGSVKRLSGEIGTNSASFSKGGKYYINTFQSVDKAQVFTLNRPKDGSVIKTLKANSTIENRLAQLNIPKKEFSMLKISDTLELNMWMMRPVDFDSTKVYPMLMFVYGGPGSQQVLNRWYSLQDMWFSLLTQKGYIIACVDGRGTGGRSADFEKIIHKQMGKLEIQDQISAAKALGERSYIDSDRIGMFGWSFGGYMASLAATKGQGTFKATIAVAPVTSWRFYDSVYTERYLSTPQLNANGYDENSPLNFAGDLSSKFLIIHGSADDNVHYQNTLRMSEELIQKNKPFEQMIYPDKAHGISGGYTSLHLFSKMTDFILQNL